MKGLLQAVIGNITQMLVYVNIQFNFHKLQIKSTHE